MNLDSGEVLGTLRYALIHRARPVSLNDIYSKHWRTKHAMVEEWKQAGWALALEQKVPHYDRIGVVCIPFGPGARQDPGNCYPSVKAFVDGLVKAKVVDDDDGDHVAYVLMLPWHPASGRDTGLHVRIYEVD
jgi:crossover junction endodeoxyribonuclease RusA